MIARRALLRSRPLARSISYTKPKPAPDATASSATTTNGNGNGNKTTSNAVPKPAAAKPSFTAQTQKSRQTVTVPSNLLYKPSTIARSSSSSATDAAEANTAEAGATIDWANSFHGISSKPVTEEQFNVLMQPLNERDIEVKPDGIIYLPEIKYRRRLNEAFGPMGWGLIPKGDAVVGDSIVTREYALIVDGRYVLNHALQTCTLRKVCLSNVRTNLLNLDSSPKLKERTRTFRPISFPRPSKDASPTP